MTKKLLLVTAPLLFTMALSVQAQEHSFKQKRVPSLASSELASLKGQSIFGFITDFLFLAEQEHSIQCRYLLSI